MNAGLRGRAVRGSARLAAGYVAEAASGYAYWLLAARMADEATVGAAGAVIGLGTLLGGVLAFGANFAVQRDVSACAGRGRLDCAAAHFRAGALVLLAGAAVGAVFAAGSALLLGGLAGYTPAQLAWAALLASAWAVNYASRAGAIALLLTRLDLAVTLAGSLLKPLAGLGLLAAGAGWEGLVAGFAAPLALRGLVLGAAVSSRLGPGWPSRGVIASTLRSGLAVWGPNVLNTAGWWLGVVAVYGYSGSVEAGQYYIASTVASFINGMIASVYSMLLVVLAASGEGERLEVAGRGLVLLYYASAPVAATLALGSRAILSLFGPGYAGAWPVLTVLALALMASPYPHVVSHYYYAQRRLGEVVKVGLALNGSRALLYPILTPALGGLGAALSVALGGAAGLAYSLAITPRGLRPWALRAAGVAAAGIAASTPALAPGGLPGAALGLALAYLAPPALRLVKPGEVEAVLAPIIGPGPARRVARLLSLGGA